MKAELDLTKHYIYINPSYYSFYISPCVCKRDLLHNIKIQYESWIYEGNDITEKLLYHWIITINTVYTFYRDDIESIKRDNIEIRDKETDERIFFDKPIIQYFIDEINKRLTNIHIDRLYSEE